MPFIVTGEAGIYGYVTFLGVAVKNIKVDLWKEAGTTHTAIASTTTNLSGYYSFTNEPALPIGQAYRVRFDNIIPPVIPNALSHWKTRAIDYPTSGIKILIGNFDIGDVALGNPADGAITKAPITFFWTRRPQSPSDSYQIRFLLFSDSTEKYLSPALGFVNSFTLSTLPTGFDIVPVYTWYVLISQPDGSAGTSSSQHRILFSAP
jgi:hypothetical protein